MNDDIIGITVTLAAVAVLVPLLLTHATHQVRQIEDAWRKLAERHRLRFTPGRKLEVAGSLAGRAFVMKSGKSGNQTTYSMELELTGPLPDGLDIKARARRSGGSEQGGAPVATVHERTGKVDIDGAVRVGAMDPGELPDYLNAARQRAALRLIAAEGKLEKRTLSIALTGHPDDLEWLDHALEELAAVAPVLEQRRQRGDGRGMRPNAVAEMLPK